MLFRSKGKMNEGSKRTLKTESKVYQPCYRCGGKHAPQVCRFKQENCHHCSKIGHIARMCRNKKLHGQTQYVQEEIKSEDDENENELFGVYTVYTASDGKQGIALSMNIEGKMVDMQVDTGAAVTLVSEVVYKEKRSHSTIVKSNMQLSTFSGQNIPIVGQVKVNAEY